MKKGKVPKKIELLENLFDIGSNAKATEVYEKLQKNFENQLKIEKDDQLRDGLRISTLYARKQSFKEKVDFMKHTINRLWDLEIENWDLYDIRILQCSISSCETFQKCQKLLSKGLEALEKYNDHELYSKIKLTLHMNILVLLVKAKLLYIDPIEAPADSKELNELFEHHSNIALSMCKSDDLKSHKQIILIRKGLFYKNYKEVDKHLEKHKNLGNKDFYNKIKAWINHYNYYNGTAISQKQTRILMGENLRNWRKSMGLTAIDISIIIGETTDPNYIYSIERGEKGLSQHALLMLTRTYNVDIDVFFKGLTSETEEITDNRKIMLSKINARMAKLNDTSLEYIYQTIESHIKLEKVFRKSN